MDGGVDVRSDVSLSLVCMCTVCEVAMMVRCCVVTDGSDWLVSTVECRSVDFDLLSWSVSAECTDDLELSECTV